MKKLVGAFAVLLCAQLLSAQTITLKPAIEAGMSWTFDSVQDMTSDNKASFNGQTQPFNSKQRQRRSGTLTVLEVKNGEPSKIRVTYDDKCETSAEMAGQKNAIPFPLVGKTLVVSRAENGQVTTDMDGQMDPNVLSEAAGLIESDAMFFPTKPVAVGDEWPAEPKGLARQLQLQGQDTAGMTLKLLSVKNDPKPTAEVKVSMAVVRSMGGMNIKLISQGTALVDIATGHVIKIDTKGTTTNSGTMSDQTPDGQMVQFQVEGTGTLTTTQDQPLKGNGGPVAGPVGPGPVGPAPVGGNPLAKKTYAGTFTDGKLTLELAPGGDGYAGTIALGENKFPATASGGAAGLAGSFAAGNDSYKFTATLDGDTVTLISDGTTYTLKRQAPKNPLAR